MGGECWLSVSHKDGGKVKKRATAREIKRGSLIEPEIDIPGTGRKHRFKDGSVKWEIEYATLADLPADDVEKFDLVYPYDILQWHHQGSLLDELDSEMVSASADGTIGYDSSGRVIAIRPDEVINSYAAYFPAKGRVLDGNGNVTEDWKNWKFCHLYASYMVAANGAKTKVRQEIVGRELRVSIPRSWCVANGFPVVLDPTFGFSGTGGSAYGIGNARFYGFLSIGTPASSGTLDSITWRAGGTNGNRITVGLYQSDGGAPPSIGGQAIVGQCSEITGVLATSGDETAIASGTVNIVAGTQYFFALNSNESTTSEFLYYDTTSTTNYFAGSHTYTNTLPSTFPNGLTLLGPRDFDFYTTYTESGGGFLATSDTAWRLLTAEQQDTAWRLLTAEQQDTAWRLLTADQQDTAWRLLSDSAAPTAWAVLAGLAADTAWRVGSAAQASTAWRLLTAEQRDTAWGILASGVASLSLAWKILITADAETASRILAAEDAETAWRLLNAAGIDIAWPVLTSDSIDAAWRLLEAVGADTAWKLANAAAQATGWRVLTQLPVDTGWASLTAAGRDAAWQILTSAGSITSWVIGDLDIVVVQAQRRVFAVDDQRRVFAVDDQRRVFQLGDQRKIFTTGD